VHYAHSFASKDTADLTCNVHRFPEYSCSYTSSASYQV